MQRNDLYMNADPRDIGHRFPFHRGGFRRAHLRRVSERYLRFLGGLLPKMARQFQHVGDRIDTMNLFRMLLQQGNDLELTSVLSKALRLRKHFPQRRYHFPWQSRRERNPICEQIQGEEAWKSYLTDQQLASTSKLTAIKH